MSIIPLQTKIDFIEYVVISSFCDPPPFTFPSNDEYTISRSAWIRSQIDNFFQNLSDAQKDLLMLLSNTIPTLEEAKEKLAKAEEKLKEAKAERVAERNFLLQQDSQQVVVDQQDQLALQQLESKFHNMQIAQKELDPNPYDLLSSGRQDGIFINWDQPLRMFKGIKRLMIRESYTQIYEMIFANLQTGLRNHLVTGVPGIGKSNFCLYFLWRYIHDHPNSPVLFESEYGSVYCFTPLKSFILTRILCYNFDYPYLVDFTAEYEPSPNIGSFTVVFSSPDSRRYKQMMKELERSSRYVMPLWKKDELTQLNQIHNICSETIDERFKIVGGVPRHIFYGTLEDIRATITQALNEKGAEIAKHFFEQGFGMKDDTISYSLIHLHPESENGYCTRRNNYQFASEEIWERLYNLHHHSILTQSATYFNGGSFAGYHFEIICLHAHPIAGTVQQITSLSNSSLQPKEISIPISLKVNFKNEQITLQPNILYIPTKKNFESGDAFFLSNENQLFVFQITVGASHPVKAHGLAHIYELFGVRNIAECHLVFVVPARGQLTSKQNITTMQDTEINRASQVVRSFQKNQWRLEYHLIVPKSETS